MWSRKEKLEARLQFRNFLEAAEFLHEVAKVAEQLGHHPDVEIHYNVVTISTTTHDAGGVVTEKDRKLAEEIERLYKRWTSRQ